MDRIEKLRSFLKDNDLDVFFICSYENRRYFSGFTGSNGYLLISQSDLILITDPRYTEQAQKQAPLYKVVTHGLNPFTTIKNVFDGLGKVKAAFESKDMTDYQLRQLQNFIPDVAWEPNEDTGITLRAVKDAEEIFNIRKAVEIADVSLNKLCDFIRPGVSERDIAIELEYIMARGGSEGPTFGTIVASGKRSSLPHGTPTDKIIEDGDMIVIDFGARWNGYMSDITRTIQVGRADGRMKEIFDIVLESQEKAVNAVRAGMTCGDLDAVHRRVFLDHGVEQFSLKGLGHGVGLEIHEFPRVVMDNTAVIEENMVFTIEPGIYIPDLGGVRIEDIVVATRDGYEVMTRSPKIICI